MMSEFSVLNVKGESISRRFQPGEALVFSVIENFA